jgi:hypothetical protein
MSIEFTIPSDYDPQHVADAIVRHGHKLTTASLWMLSGQLVAEAPAEQRLDPDLEAAILESYEITERYAF